MVNFRTDRSDRLRILFQVTACLSSLTAFWLFLYLLCSASHFGYWQFRIGCNVFSTVSRTVIPICDADTEVVLFMFFYSAKVLDALFRACYACIVLPDLMALF